MHSELATNLGNKKSLAEELFFQSFFFDTLALPKNFLASGKLAENNFHNKKLADSSFPQTRQGACKEQLLQPCFPAARENKQLYSNLVQQSVAKAASHKELCPAYSQRAPGQQELLQRELPEAQLEDRTSARTPFQTAACREELLSSRDLHQDSFSANSLTEESFSPATSQTAALRTRPSDRQLQRQQLGNSIFQNSSFDKNTFDTGSFSEHSLDDNTFHRSTFKGQTFAKSSFEKNSLEDTNFAENSFKEPPSRKTPFQKKALTQAA